MVMQLVQEILNINRNFRSYVGFSLNIPSTFNLLLQQINADMQVDCKKSVQLALKTYA